MSFYKGRETTCHHTNVCFKCREALRRPNSACNPKCPVCGKRMFCIGYQLRIPTKYREKEWKKLWKFISKKYKGLIAHNKELGVENE
jgi:hypothetical protein